MRAYRAFGCPKFDFYDGFRGLSHSNSKARQSVSLPGLFTCWRPPVHHGRAAASLL